MRSAASVRATERPRISPSPTDAERLRACTYPRPSARAAPRRGSVAELAGASRGRPRAGIARCVSSPTPCHQQQANASRDHWHPHTSRHGTRDRQQRPIPNPAAAKVGRRVACASHSPTFRSAPASARFTVAISRSTRLDPGLPIIPRTTERTARRSARRWHRSLSLIPHPQSGPAALTVAQPASRPCPRPASASSPAATLRNCDRPDTSPRRGR